MLQFQELYDDFVDGIKGEKSYLREVLALLGIQMEKRWMAEKNTKRTELIKSVT